MIWLKPLSSFKRRKILIVTHSGADVDAICAAGALFFCLSRKNKAKIIVPEHISTPAKALAKRLKIPYEIAWQKKLQADTLILVDFNELKMAGNLGPEIKRFKGKTFLIDHHAPGKKQLASAKNSLIDPNAVASCELVFDWMKKSNVKMDRKIATCIAAGIVTDSAFFLTANSKTFAIMSESLDRSGRSFSTILSQFRVKQGFDEKIAKLKAAKRARIFLISEYIGVTADVGAFESDAASTLVKIGADIAFAGDSEEGKLRISGRASQRVLKKAGFSLARHVFQQMPKYFQGSGGGHAGAAGFNGQGKDINAALQQCISLTKDFFRKRKGFRFKEYT